MPPRRRVPAALRASAAFRRLPREARADLVRDQGRVAEFLNEVDFPEFVRGLIEGTFDALVNASIEQMEAYAELMAGVAGSVERIAREPITPEGARDWLVATYPHLFVRSARVRLREGASLTEALEKANQLPVEGGALKALDDESEGRLVAAAIRHVEAERRRTAIEILRTGLERIAR